MSADRDDRLREAYARLVQQRRPGDRGACPTPEALLATVERAGAEDERLRVFDHVMACAPCREDFDLLRTSAQAAVAAGASMHWSRRPAARLLGVAASLLLVAGLSTFFSGGGNSVGVTRGGPPFALHEARRLPIGGTVLSWRPVPGADVRYELTVLDDAGRSVVETRIADTMFVLADSLAGARELVWSVAAVLPDGSTLGPLSAPIPRLPR